MQPMDIERAIRQATYTAYFAGESGVGLHDVRETIKADEQLFEQVVADLYNRGLIHPHAAGWYYRITPHGIFSAEENGIVADDVAETNRDVRHRILVYLTEAHEAERHHYGRPYEQIATDLELELSVVRPNLLLLTDIHYVQAPGSGAFRISGDGLQAVAEWRRKTAIAQEFENLSQMLPQARGREFQRLFAGQIGQEGWEQREGARTSNEEMDVVLYKDHIYYVVECKWLGKAVGAAVVRELFGKLGNRSGVRGIVVSMSGFAKGAIKEVEDKAGQATILLFGPEDTRSIFHFEATFGDLLKQKLDGLIVTRKAIFR
jgi:Restriction endonuclease